MYVKFFYYFCSRKSDRRKNMDVTILIIAGILMVIGIIGCVVPGLPGVPVSLAGLVVAQFSEQVDFPWWVFLVWGIVTVIVSVLDYIVPAWGTKHFGGTPQGMRGSVIGVFIGLFLGPIGVIIGPYLGAYIAETTNGMEREEAMRAAMGAFLGVFFGMVLKLICSIWMLVELLIAIF